MYKIDPLAHLSWKLKDLACLIACWLSLSVFIIFSHFHLLLQNYLANFNQTWHKASLGVGDSNLFIWRATLFPRGDNSKNSKNTLTTIIKKLLSPFHPYLAKNILEWWKLGFFKSRVILFFKRRWYQNCNKKNPVNLPLQNH